MDDAATRDIDEQPAPVRELTRPQRRVLGVLVEKGITTPDAYPLTLKAVTTGCNQKSNRDPVTNYSEDAVEETLDQLREMGLVAVVHTESGRTERFRHFVRKRYPFTEPQLAIMTELWLRGRQQLGELRSRASRMAPIDSQEDLREHLQQLAADNYVRSNGPLERRGIEVDHACYMPGEAPAFSAVASHGGEVAERTSPAAVSSSVPGVSADEFDALRGEMAEMKSQLAELADEVAELKRNLGV